MPKIQHVDIKDLHHAEANPRKITKEQFEKLCANIEEDKAFFESRPLLVNLVGDKYTVYAGNQRLRAAKKLRWLTVPCIVDLNLPEPIMKKRVVLDNIHHGEFDWDELANNYDPLELIALGMDPASLLGVMNEEEDKSEPKGKKAKCITCPSCGHEFTNG